MPLITLTPVTGENNPLGSGPIQFYSPNAPLLAIGDPWFLIGSGLIPNVVEVGYEVPTNTSGNATPTYFGNVSAEGNIEIAGTATVAGDISVQGVFLATGILPPGGPVPINMFGYHYVTMVQAAPPPPPTPPGLANLVAAVQASWTSHVPVASTFTDGVLTPYMSNPPYWAGPQQVNVPTTYGLSNAKASLVASLLGGSVVQAPATGFYNDPDAVDPATGTIDGWQPSVNWIYATINGVASKALGMNLVQAFNTTMQGNLQAAIEAAFTPVA